VGLHDAVERGILVPADHEHVAIGKLGVSSAEDVVARDVPTHGSVGCGVPNHRSGEGIVRHLLGRVLPHRIPNQHLAVRQDCLEDRHDAGG
jgi:hypothetical protein